MVGCVSNALTWLDGASALQAARDLYASNNPEENDPMTNCRLQKGIRKLNHWTVFIGHIKIGTAGG